MTQPSPSPTPTPRPARLREAHAHLAALGESLTIPSLAGCTCIGNCLESLRNAAAAAPPGAWVRLAAARVAGWTEGRWPTLADLDAVSPDRPCVIMSFDHHAAAANSLAIAAAGLRPGVRVGANGVVETDADGAPTGLLLEDAAYTAWGAAPEASPAQRLEFVAAALAHLAALGFVEVHDLHSQPWLGPVLAELDSQGRLPLSVWLYPPLAGLDRQLAELPMWRRPRVRLGGAKVFADGTLNSRTALMLHRYAEPLLGHPRGVAMMSPAALDEAYRRVSAAGDLPLAVHAIGDGAVRMVLDSLHRVRGAQDQPGKTAGGLGRHRIEHCEILDAADVPRFARMGVVCSVQPCHLLADVEALTRFVPHRLDRVLPLRELIDSGCAPGPGGLLWAGSDVPIVPADPQDSIQAAVERARPATGPHPAAAIAPRQAISQAEAWAAFAPTDEPTPDTP